MTTGEQLKQKFDGQWGPFRQYIAANPLTGFWIGTGAGFVLSYPVRWLFGI